MYLLIQDRTDKFHISDYTSNNGSKFCLCEKLYLKNERINTFTVDNSILNLRNSFCKKCFNSFLGTTSYFNMKNTNFLKISASYNNNKSKYYLENNYMYLEDRFWKKLLIMKRSYSKMRTHK